MKLKKNPTDTERVTCHVCGAMVHLHSDGSYYAHGLYNATVSGHVVYCKGSDRPHSDSPRSCTA